METSGGWACSSDAVGRGSSRPQLAPAPRGNAGAGQTFRSGLRGLLMDVELRNAQAHCTPLLEPVGQDPAVGAGFKPAPTRQPPRGDPLVGAVGGAARVVARPMPARRGPRPSGPVGTGVYRGCAAGGACSRRLIRSAGRPQHGAPLTLTRLGGLLSREVRPAGVGSRGVRPPCAFCHPPRCRPIPVLGVSVSLGHTFVTVPPMP